jgi:RNA polymerase sigma factor (sigma-70 family)
MTRPSVTTADTSADYAGAFQEHERFLWGLCYRLTGSAADADDLVQETFVRAIEHPPAHTEQPWRPWLVRVAVNLGRDLLRRRRRRGAYVGPWLPSPIDTGDQHAPPAFEPAVDGLTTEGRYDLLESVTFAFLLALEALTPRQRAVLLLRDVFDYSVREVGDSLDMSEASVKTSHHRARRAMRDHDRARHRPTRALQEETRRALDRLVGALATHDVASVEALLSEDVRALSDSAGQFHAARVPIVGAKRVALFYTRIASRRADGVRSSVRMLNGLPALVVEFADEVPGEASTVVIRLDVATDGRIRTLHSVLAPRKLTAIGAQPGA